MSRAQLPGQLKLSIMNQKIQFTRVINIILVIILIGILVFGWWYLNQKNPLDMIGRIVSPRSVKPRYLFSIYGNTTSNLNRPSYTTVNRDKIYVADTNHSRIVVFNYKGQYLSDFGQTGQGKLQYPVDICFVGEQIFIADIGTKKIHVFKLDGSFLGYFAEKGASFPASIFYNEQKFYVIDRAQMNVEIFDSNGKEIMAFGKLGMGPGEFYFPYSIFVKNEKIYIADSNNNRIQIFDKQGKLLKILLGNDSTGQGKYAVPRGTAFDENGNLYTAEGLINSISITNPEGQVVSRFRYAEPSKQANGVEDEINLPTSVFIDDNQRLYVTEFGKSRVIVYQIP